MKSYDGNYYICNTYNQTLRKNKMPCQAVAYKLRIEVLPNIYYLNRLERPLVSRIILFKKITVMPKDKLLKVKGSICNIRVTEVDVSCNMLLRSADSKVKT